MRSAKANRRQSQRSRRWKCSSRRARKMHRLSLRVVLKRMTACATHQFCTMSTPAIGVIHKRAFTRQALDKISAGMPRYALVRVRLFRHRLSHHVHQSRIVILETVSSITHDVPYRQTQHAHQLLETPRCLSAVFEMIHVAKLVVARIFAHSLLFAPP